MATENSNNTFIQTPYEYLVNVPQFDIPASFYSLPFYNSASDEKTKIFSYMDTVLYNFLSYLITIYPFGEKPGNSNKTIEKVLNYVNNLMFIDNHDDKVPTYNIYEKYLHFNTLENDDTLIDSMRSKESNIEYSILALRAIDILRHFFLTSMLYLRNNSKITNGTGASKSISFYLIKSPIITINSASFDLYRVEFYFNYFDYEVTRASSQSSFNYLYNYTTVKLKMNPSIDKLINNVNIKKYEKINIMFSPKTDPKKDDDYFRLTWPETIHYGTNDYKFEQIIINKNSNSKNNVILFANRSSTLQCNKDLYSKYINDNKQDTNSFLFYIKILFLVDSIVLQSDPIFNSKKQFYSVKNSKETLITSLVPNYASRIFIDSNSEPSSENLSKLVNDIKNINNVVDEYLYSYNVYNTDIDMTKIIESKKWLFYETIIQYSNNYNKSIDDVSKQFCITFNDMSFLNFSKVMSGSPEYYKYIYETDARQVYQKRSTQSFINVLFTTNDYWLTGVSDKVADTDKIVIDDSYNLLRKLENETQRKYYEYESLGKNATVTISHLDYNPSSKISYKGVDFQSIPLELDPSNYLINIYSETDKKSYRAILLPKNTLFNKNEKGYNIYELYEISQVDKNINFNENTIHFYVPENSLFGNINFTYSIKIDENHKRLMIVLLSNIDAGFVKALCEAYKATDVNHKNELKNKFNLLLKILKRIK